MKFTWKQRRDVELDETRSIRSSSKLAIPVTAARVVAKPL